MSDLTKWPRLLIEGDPVTPKQAAEIIFRTTGWDYIHGNDRGFTDQVCEVVGLPPGKHGWPEWEDVQAFQQRHQILSVEYLHNSRIASSWIGGPHGWCSWEGFIGCSNYNIGKWPSTEEMQADLDKIAQAFPYLRMTVQLVPDEGMSRTPLCQWDVREGTAALVEPAGLLTPPTEAPMTFLNRFGERGITIGDLREKWATFTSEDSALPA
jgi:hypothetical protein